MTELSVDKESGDDGRMNTLCTRSPSPKNNDGRQQVADVTKEYQAALFLKNKINTSAASVANLTRMLETGLKYAGDMCTSTCSATSELNRAALNYTNQNTFIAKTRDIATNYEVGESAAKTIEDSSRRIRDAALSMSIVVDNAVGHIRDASNRGVDTTLHAVRSFGNVLDTSDDISFQRLHPFIEVVTALYDIMSPVTIKVGKALVALSHLQRIGREPYPPRSSPMLDFSLRTNRDLVAELKHRYIQCLSVYNSRFLKMLGIVNTNLSCLVMIRSILGVDEDDILFARTFSEVNAPAFIVVRDHTTKSICVVIRGSTEVADVFTDLCCRIDPSTGGHTGMQRSAEFVDVTSRSLVHELCEKHLDYNVVVVGHSLGGGTATLLTMTWLSDPIIAGPDLKRLHGFSFGSPCVTSLEISNKLKDHVTSVIYGRDIVSRASLGSLMNLNKILCHLCGVSSPEVLPIESPSVQTSVSYSSRTSRRTESFESACGSTETVVVNLHQLSSQAEISNYKTPMRSLEEFLMASNLSSSPSSSNTNSPRNSTTPFLLDIPSKTLSHSASLNNIPLSSVNGDDTVAGLQQGPQFRSCQNLSIPLEQVTAESLTEWVASHRGLHPNETHSVVSFWKNRLQNAWSALKSLRDVGDTLSPAGRCLIMIPRHHLHADEIPSDNFFSGDCIIRDLSPHEAFEMASEIVLQQSAFADHGPHTMAQALGVMSEGPLCMNVPSPLS